MVVEGLGSENENGVKSVQKLYMRVNQGEIEPMNFSMKFQHESYLGIGNMIFCDWKLRHFKG